MACLDGTVGLLKPVSPESGHGPLGGQQALVLPVFKASPHPHRQQTFLKPKDLRPYEKASAFTGTGGSQVLEKQATSKDALMSCSRTMSLWHSPRLLCYSSVLASVGLLGFGRTLQRGWDPPLGGTHRDLPGQTPRSPSCSQHTHGGEPPPDICSLFFLPLSSSRGEPD